MKFRATITFEYEAAPEWYPEQEIDAMIALDKEQMEHDWSLIVPWLEDTSYVVDIQPIEEVETK